MFAHPAGCRMLEGTREWGTLHRACNARHEAAQAASPAGRGRARLQHTASVSTAFLPPHLQSPRAALNRGHSWDIPNAAFPAVHTTSNTWELPADSPEHMLKNSHFNSGLPRSTARARIL